MTSAAPRPAADQDDVDLSVPLAPDDVDTPHDASGEQTDLRDLAGTAPPPRASRRWTPRRVVVTPAALDTSTGVRIVERVERLGIEVERLAANRLTGVRGETDRETYARAKSTLAVVVSPPSRRKLQPIAPSADWRVDLAEGCPAHCQYCYLAGSLSGPPVTRVYADLDEILDGLTRLRRPRDRHQPQRRRAHEGTTFEASCYTDPLALDHLTGSLAAGRASTSARGTTPCSCAGPPSTTTSTGSSGCRTPGRTRVRLSVNCLPVTTRFEGGTSPLEHRLAALRRLALDGYPVGLTIAPIMPVPGWRDHYGHLLGLVADAVEEVQDLDLTAELITHRFTPGSKDVLTGWYPRTKLEMDESQRSRKHGKYGAVKYVYPAT